MHGCEYTGIKNNIIDSISEIFSTMIFMGVTAEEEQSADTEPVEDNIIGMIGLGGDVKGVVSAHMPNGVAIGITTSFLGIEPEEINDDVKDAIGEVVNMLAGGLKNYFLENQIETELAIPSTIVGKSFKTGGLTGAERIKVPFTCDSGRFFIELKYVLQPKNP